MYTDIAECLFIRCVGGCSPYLTQELLGVLIIAQGLR